MRKSGTLKATFIEPMYAAAVRKLPEGAEWLYEIKFDGYRCIAARDDSGAHLWSRRANSFTKQFPEIAAACKKLPLGTVVDGEVVALDAHGRASFNLLQHHRDRAAALKFYIFDLLVDRGKNITDRPLSDRRRALDKLKSIAVTSSPISLSEAIDAPLAELIRSAKELGLEGIIAKRRDSIYESGRRSGAWLKYKINRGQEFIIGGYTRGKPFDSIVVGYYDGSKLMFASKVRAGFVPHVRREVMEKMKPLQVDVCPFANLPEKRRTQWALTAEGMKDCIWLKPRLVAQIEFTEWTPDGHLRHAAFSGMREDKKPRDVVREET